MYGPHPPSHKGKHQKVTLAYRLLELKFESKDLFFIAFSKTNPLAKSLSYLEGW
jgi:hypothetical protein